MMLKQAGLVDYEVIFDILYENAIWLESKGIVQWPLLWLESKRTEIQESVSRGAFYYVEVDNIIAAVVELSTAQETIWNYEEGPALYIHKLAIRREFSRQGLGHRVLTLIKARAIQENNRYLRLDCVAHNERLCQYYQSCNFELKIIIKTLETDLALFEYPLESR